MSFVGYTAGVRLFPVALRVEIWNISTFQFARRLWVLVLGCVLAGAGGSAAGGAVDIGWLDRMPPPTKATSCRIELENKKETGKWLVLLNREHKSSIIIPPGESKTGLRLCEDGFDQNSFKCGMVAVFKSCPTGESKSIEALQDFLSGDYFADLDPYDREQIRALWNRDPPKLGDSFWFAGFFVYYGSGPNVLWFSVADQDVVFEEERGCLNSDRADFRVCTPNLQRTLLEDDNAILFEPKDEISRDSEEPLVQFILY